MSAFAILHEAVPALTWPQLIGVGTFAIIVAGFILKIFLVINAGKNETDNKITKAKEDMQDDIGRKVDLSHYKPTIQRLEESITRNKEIEEEHYQNLVKVMEKQDKKLDQILSKK